MLEERVDSIFWTSVRLGRVSRSALISPFAWFMRMPMSTADFWAPRICRVNSSFCFDTSCSSASCLSRHPSTSLRRGSTRCLLTKSSIATCCSEGASSSECMSVSAACALSISALVKSFISSTVSCNLVDMPLSLLSTMALNSCAVASSMAMLSAPCLFSLSRSPRTFSCISVVRLCISSAMVETSPCARSTSSTRDAKLCSLGA
mmetsp:Transcript_41063/g.114122  ORF Transcript_41063/g.114122 Transcript_41063/m.114122 type:complete len:205 (+) Transcript_41063:1041-1655(+)